MIDIYEGDPKIFIDEEGAEFNFPGDGGQPEMEQGVENVAIISLFTRTGWAGNFYLRKQSQKIGSDYEVNTDRPITLSSLDAIRQSTLTALDDPIFSNVSSVVTAPGPGRLNNIIKAGPPGRNLDEIVVQRNGLNWILQSQKEQEI